MGDDFGRYLALGVTIVVVVQGFINMSVVLGMMPTKGIPLPMISYGGSSLLVHAGAAGDADECQRKCGVECELADEATFVMAGGGTGGHVIPATCGRAGAAQAGVMTSSSSGPRRGIESAARAGGRLSHSKNIEIGGLNRRRRSSRRYRTLWRLPISRSGFGGMPRFADRQPRPSSAWAGMSPDRRCIAALAARIPRRRHGAERRPGIHQPRDRPLRRARPDLIPGDRALLSARAHRNHRLARARRIFPDRAASRGAKSCTC